MTNSGFDNMTFKGKNPLSNQKINRISGFETTPADKRKIEIPINKKKVSATYNTDGIINKLVMVFALCSYPHDRFVTTCTANAPVLSTEHILPGLLPYSPETLYRDTRKTQQVLYPDSKNTCHTLLAP